MYKNNFRRHFSDYLVGHERRLSAADHVHGCPKSPDVGKLPRVALPAAQFRTHERWRTSLLMFDERVARRKYSEKEVEMNRRSRMIGNGNISG